jgi:hypothetical protein
MDAATLSALAQASREREIGPFRVRLPSQFDLFNLASAVGEDDAAHRAFQERLAVQALIGWRLTVGAVAPGAPNAEELLPFDPALAPVILAERRDLRAVLLTGFWSEIESRRLAFEADEKN